MNKDIVIIEELEKYFPPTMAGWRSLLQPLTRPTLRALVGVSFAVGSGEVLAVIGANGAGKSTLLRILATLVVPSRGRVVVAGFDVEREPARVRREIGFHAGSSPGFYGRLSARENLEFFAALNNLGTAEASRSIAKVVDLMGLGEVLGRQVRTLSTGMVHRLSLARALLHAPAILVLDEPTHSLDPLTATEFRIFLKTDLVRQRGTTLIFATHLLSEVEELADRVALLHLGRLLAYDKPQGLCASVHAGTLEQALETLSHRDAVEPF